MSNLGLVLWALAILGAWFSLTHQGTNYLLNMSTFQTLFIYVALNIESGIIIKIIINSYSFCSVTLKEIMKSNMYYKSVLPPFERAGFYKAVVIMISILLTSS